MAISHFCDLDLDDENENENDDQNLKSLEGHENEELNKKLPILIRWWWSEVALVGVVVVARGGYGSDLGLIREPPQIAPHRAVSTVSRPQKNQVREALRLNIRRNRTWSSRHF